MTQVDAARFWDKEVVAPTHNSWLADEAVRRYVNGMIGGWPMDWFQRHYPNRFPIGLSIGCGTGALERDLLARGICERIDAFDASEQSLEIARAAAAKQGIADRVCYSRDDFEIVRLPRRAYDIVFFHQSLHHVSHMERLLRQVRRALRPGGVVYFDEFVGPSRTFWNDRTAAWYRALYELLPASTHFPEGMGLPVQWDDASEAVRSGEIESRIRAGFDVEHFQGYGGNVLAVMFPSTVAGSLTPELVETLIETEKRVLAGGAPSFYALIAARPKRGLAGLLATLRYLADPKLRRVQRQLLGRLSAPEEDRFRM
jgi:SAM-dependent methyltransferase